MENLNIGIKHMRLNTFLLAVAAGFAATAGSAAVHSADLVVYGSSPAAISAAVQAAQAIAAGCAVQDLPYEKLCSRLVADGQRLPAAAAVNQWGTPRAGRARSLPACGR